MIGRITPAVDQFATWLVGTVRARGRGTTLVRVA